MRPLIYPFRPSMIEATAITEVTPITMPSTVSADRPLRARNVSSATARFSRMSRSPNKLLRPQRGYRIEPRGSHSWIDSEEDPDYGTEHDTQQCHPELHRSWKRGEGSQGQRAQESDANADAATHYALHY